MFLSLLAPKDFAAGGTGPLFCIISGGYWVSLGPFPSALRATADETGRLLSAHIPSPYVEAHGLQPG